MKLLTLTRHWARLQSRRGTTGCPGGIAHSHPSIANGSMPVDSPKGHSKSANLQSQIGNSLVTNGTLVARESGARFSLWAHRPASAVTSATRPSRNVPVKNTAPFARRASRYASVKTAFTTARPAAKPARWCRRTRCPATSARSQVTGLRTRETSPARPSIRLSTPECPRRFSAALPDQNFPILLRPCHV